MPSARREVVGLLVPADPALPARLVSVPYSGPAFSDAIGGGRLDDPVPLTLLTLTAALYLDLDRAVDGLPANERLAGVLDALADVDGPAPGPITGDALIVGRDAADDDVDLPPRLAHALLRRLAPGETTAPLVAPAPPPAPGAHRGRPAPQRRQNAG